MVANQLHFIIANNASDSVWRSIWQRMVGEGTAITVFCDGTVVDEDGFVSEMNAPHVHPYIVCVDGTPAAVVWLTNLEGRMARGHFVTFKAYSKMARHLGRFAFQQLLTYTYEDGSYCFDVIFGMIPCSNMLAVNTCIKSGFKKVGVLPNGAWIAAKGKSENMIVTAVTREDVL